MKQFPMTRAEWLGKDTVALPQTPPGEVPKLSVVAAFLKHIQTRYKNDMTNEDRDRLAEMRILVDVLLLPADEE